jgi:amidophosphoribosyltransferase
MRISCPPTRHPCYFGIDFPSREELVAATVRDVDAIRETIGADSLGYVSIEGLLSAVEHPGDFCTGCFTGNYPMEVKEQHTKNALETAHAMPV